MTLLTELPKNQITPKTTKNRLPVPNDSTTPSLQPGDSPWNLDFQTQPCLSNRAMCPGTAETWSSGAATKMRAPLEPQRRDERGEDSRRENLARIARFRPFALRWAQRREQGAGRSKQWLFHDLSSSGRELSVSAFIASLRFNEPSFNCMVTAYRYMTPDKGINANLRASLRRR